MRKWFFLLFGFFISAVLVLGTNTIWGCIAGLTLMAITAFIVSDFYLLHPFIWFVPFFFFYSVSFPLQVAISSFEPSPMIIEVVILEWIALAIFTLIIGPHTPKKHNFIPIQVSTAIFDKVKKMAYPMLLFSLGLSVLYIGYLIHGNFVSKPAISLANSPLTRLGFSFRILTLSYAILLISKLKKGRFPVLITLSLLIWSILSFLISGERDIIVIFLWVSLFVYHFFYRRLSKKILIFLAIWGICFFVLLGYLKNVFYRPINLPVRPNLFFTQLLTGEFKSASANLHKLLSERENWSFFLGKTLIWDIRKAIIPGFLFPKVQNPVGWFNRTFYYTTVESGRGRGFTLVGEGYMNFGVLGVMGWIALFAIFLKKLYLKSHRSLIWFVIYILIMPICIYIIRADFSNLISPFLKQIIIPLGIMYSCSENRYWRYKK